MAIHQQEVIVFLPNHIDYLVTFFFHRVDEAVGEVIIKSYILILGASSVDFIRTRTCNDTVAEDS